MKTNEQNNYSKSTEESLFNKHYQRYKYMFGIELEDKSKEEKIAILKASIRVAEELLADE
jgi:hypothetical protein